MTDSAAFQRREIPSLHAAPQDRTGTDVASYRLVPIPNRGEPTLAPSAYRIVQASRRANELLPIVEQAGTGWSGKHPTPRAPLSENEPTDFGVTLEDFSEPRVEFLNEMTFLASECINHVRTALDYLAFHVVWRDRGKPHAHTKFPLSTERDGFGKIRRSALPGITAIHKQWIEEVQPFTGTEWSTALEELSNRDKHRVPLEVVESYGFEIDASKVFLDPLGDANFRGFQVENPTLTYLLGDPFQGSSMKPHLEVQRTMDIVIQGAAVLVNQFLQEWGYSELVLQSAGRDQH